MFKVPNKYSVSNILHHIQNKFRTHVVLTYWSKMITSEVYNNNIIEKTTCTKSLKHTYNSGWIKYKKEPKYSQRFHGENTYVFQFKCYFQFLHIYRNNNCIAHDHKKNANTFALWAINYLGFGGRAELVLSVSFLLFPYVSGFEASSPWISSSNIVRIIRRG